MKKAFRLLAFALACMMLVAVFVACDSSSNKEDDTSSSQGNNNNNNSSTGAVEPAPIEQKNYNDSFMFLACNDVFQDGYFFAKEQTQEVMNNAVFTRQEEVKSQIGVEVSSKQHENFQEYYEEFKTSVKAQDGIYQSCLTHCNYGIASLVTEGMLYDFNDLSSIDLTKDYWNKDIMESLAYNDSLYLGYGDFCLAYTYVLAFNKDLLDKYCATTLGDSTIYDLVTEKKWTIDKMMEIASKCHDDKNGDGKKDAGDIFGISGYFWPSGSSMLQASGIDIVEYNTKTGKYEFSISKNAKKVEDLVSKVNEMYQSEYAYLWGPWSEPMEDASKQVQFKDGKTLFQFYGTYHMAKQLTSVDVNFGVLPYPMWDEQQGEYRSLSWNGYITVPYYLSKSEAEMVSDTLELLAFYSEPVTTAFYEKLLGAQVADSRDDSDMLDIVWDSQVVEFALAYSDKDTQAIDAMVYCIPRIIFNVDNTSTFTGYWAQKGMAATIQLSKLQAKK